MGDHVFGNTMWAGHWLWMLVVAVVVVTPVWRICQRTGYPGWLGTEGKGTHTHNRYTQTHPTQCATNPHR